MLVGDGQTNARRPRPGSLQEKVPHSISDSSTHSAFEARPDHHGIDVTGLDNSRLSDPPSYLTELDDHRFNIVTNNSIQEGDVTLNPVPAPIKSIRGIDS
jgi:hypothetical protein